jgi:hypothetical protein
MRSETERRHEEEGTELPHPVMESKYSSASKEMPVFKDVLPPKLRSNSVITLPLYAKRAIIWNFCQKLV